VIANRLPDESNDSVNLIVSLLVRHPELSRVRIKPRFAAIAFFFIVRERLSDNEQARVRARVLAHVHALHRLDGTRAPRIDVRFRTERNATFVEIERDTRTLAREEISLVVELVALEFGERLMVNPPSDEALDDDLGGRDDAVGSALDAGRRGKQRKGLVGLRDDRRVLIYFGK